MKKFLIILAVAVSATLLFYAFNTYIYDEKQGNQTPALSHKDASYMIDGRTITLKDSVSEIEAVPGSASKIVTRYFGNEVRRDLNEDGREDVVFLMTQETGGTGTFYYVVAALNMPEGYIGSQGLLLGDRIAPQTTKMSRDPGHINVIVVNYAERKPGESFATPPSVGKSIWLKLDSNTMQFGEVVQNFEGEADPARMTLTMKTWIWIKTTYNNDTELVPKKTEAFTLTFREDGSFSATTDCNIMSGAYEVKDDQITFKDIVATRMFCEGSQEREFSSMLGEVQSFFFTNRGELVLGLKFDSGSVIFR
ncbi:MAG: META domain-containing protein [Candidatus Yonathbacteria bacterium]|nr:META domain-containing protein [Candidatus Yonathbacteria bacterium]